MKKKNDNNLSFEVKQNITYLLSFNKQSCRYDSFSFLFFSTIYKLLLDSPTTVKSNNLKDFMFLINKIYNSIQLNQKKIFGN